MSIDRNNPPEEPGAKRCEIVGAEDIRDEALRPKPWFLQGRDIQAPEE